MSVGIVFEDLEDHEGYAARRLADGRLTSALTPARFTAYAAACGCGSAPTPARRGRVDRLRSPPTEEGRTQAEAAWGAGHAQPLLARAVPHEMAQLVAEARREVCQLARNRPVASMAVLRHLRACGDRVAEIASACAIEHGNNVDPPGGPVRRPPTNRPGPAIGL